MRALKTKHKTKHIPHLQGSRKSSVQIKAARKHPNVISLKWLRGSGCVFFGFSFKWPDDPGCKKTETQEGEDGAGRLRPFVANSLASLHTVIGSTRANHTGITNSKLCSHRGRTTAFLGSVSFYLKSTSLRKPTILVNQTRTSVLHLVPKCQTAVMKQLFPVRLKVEDGFIKSSISQENHVVLQQPSIVFCAICLHTLYLVLDSVATMFLHWNVILFCSCGARMVKLFCCFFLIPTHTLFIRLD